MASHGRDAAIAPGNHDGVHRGHQALVHCAREIASARNLVTAAMFFDPHPSRVFQPNETIRELTTPERRIELLKHSGADEVFVEAFDRDFAQLSPRAFVERILVEKRRARAVVVGPDFRFGKDRAGDLATLERLGAELGFTVHPLPPVVHAGEVVSSTRIRDAIARGEVELATDLLNRLHDVRGTVVRGDQRGRTIGFPTANLDCEPTQLPADGVYAVVARRLDRSSTQYLHGVANLGVRPTFGAGRSLEAFFFDFDEDIYGESLRVGFVARLRAEMKFAGIAALKGQIERDCVAGRNVLSAAAKEHWAWF